MMMAQNASGSKFPELLESMAQLFRFVEQAAEAGKPVHEVERGIWQRLPTLGRQALEEFFRAQGTGDVGETFTMPEGRELQRLEERHPRCYQGKKPTKNRWRRWAAYTASILNIARPKRW
jgi:hypothetical protein